MTVTYELIQVELNGNACKKRDQVFQSFHFVSFHFFSSITAV